jgi:Archaeal PaREP1/PaREP8 family.
VKLVEAILEIGREVAREEANDAVEGKLDAEEVVKIRLDTADFYLEQAKVTMDHSHTLASEMLFRAVVEGIKALGDYFRIERELRELPTYLSEILGDWVENAWEIGKRLHYDGYIFEFMQKDDVLSYMKVVEDFLKNCRLAVL